MSINCLDSTNFSNESTSKTFHSSKSFVTINEKINNSLMQRRKKLLSTINLKSIKIINDDE